MEEVVTVEAAAGEAVGEARTAAYQEPAQGSQHP